MSSVEFVSEPTCSANITTILYSMNPKLYTPSTLNNSNETHTFMCLGRAGRFGQH